MVPISCWSPRPSRLTQAHTPTTSTRPDPTAIAITPDIRHRDRIHSEAQIHAHAVEMPPWPGSAVRGRADGCNRRTSNARLRSVAPAAGEAKQEQKQVDEVEV